MRTNMKRRLHINDFEAEKITCKYRKISIILNSAEILLFA